MCGIDHAANSSGRPAAGNPGCAQSAFGSDEDRAPPPATGMVEAGVGVAIVPHTAAARCRRTMATRRLNLPDARTSPRLLQCVRRPEPQPSHAPVLVHTTNGRTTGRETVEAY